MKMIELINVLLWGVMAVSLAVIALQLSRLAGHVHTLVPLLRRYFDAFLDDHIPHHFFYTAQDLLVWEWRNGTWRLRTAGPSAANAGPPPQRPGTYDGECVTTRRSGKSS